MIRVLFFVVLVMALVALRSNLRVRRTFTHIGIAIPRHLNTGLLLVGGVVLMALANLVGLGTGLGVAGLIGSAIVIGIGLARAAVDHTRGP